MEHPRCFLQANAIKWVGKWIYLREITVEMGLTKNILCWVMLHLFGSSGSFVSNLEVHSKGLDNPLGFF